MTALAHTLADSATMARRQVKHMRRYPSLTLMQAGLPILFLLLFVYVFGGTMGAGLGPSGGREEYLNYLVPGIMLLGLAGGATGTAIAVAMDMVEGVVARFRTMAIARVSVLTGHVIGGLMQTMLSVTVVVAAALLLGFRPTAGPVEWLGVVGVVAMAAFAVTWFAVALGLVTRSVETASNLPQPLLILPFLGSGFVPTDTMPAGLRWFAEYQPFTPVIETLRGLLMGTEIGGDAWLAAAWCAVIALVGYVWAKYLYNRDPSR